MKNTLIAFVAAVSMSAAPVMAQGFSIGSVTPTLDFPKPAPDSVSQDQFGIDK